MRRGILGIGLCAALFYAGYDWIDDNVELVTLQVSGDVDEYDPRLFVVDDPDEPDAIWVRAERPDRLWLDPLRSNPSVVVHRGDRDLAYQAHVWDGESNHEQVDELFRAKYGVIDSLAAWIWRRDAVPIRLEPRQREIAHHFDFAPAPVTAPPLRYRSNNPHQTNRSHLHHHV